MYKWVSVSRQGRDRSPTSSRTPASPTLTGRANDRAINLGAINASTSPNGRDSDLPRKEVIQPHLPVRLPCYDFVPITGFALDGWPPRGSPRRLQAPPAFMT